MKVIGLIGGMSWESTVTYYQIINEVIKEKLGGFHSAKILLYSVDFHEIEECQSRSEWDKSAEILGKAAQSLEKGGADFILICTNTMHKVANQIQSMINIPIIHIADTTADALIEKNKKTVALLGTKYTMTQDFISSKLEARGIKVLTPSPKDIEIINDVIYNELCLGKIEDNSRKEYLRIIQSLKEKGAEGVILGCTEIGLLINQDCCDIPVFDTTIIHATKGALLSLE